VAVGYVGNRDGAAKTVRLVEDLGRRACAVQLDQAEAGAIDGAVAGAPARASPGVDVVGSTALMRDQFPPRPAQSNERTRTWYRALESGTEAAKYARE